MPRCIHTPYSVNWPHLPTCINATLIQRCTLMYMRCRWSGGRKVYRKTCSRRDVHADTADPNGSPSHPLAMTHLQSTACILRLFLFKMGRGRDIDRCNERQTALVSPCRVSKAPCRREYTSPPNGSQQRNYGAQKQQDTRIPSMYGVPDRVM